MVRHSRGALTVQQDRPSITGVVGDTSIAVLLWVVDCGHEQIMQLLLERGADVNAAGGYYLTALKAASWQGHEQIVRLLLINRVFNALQEAAYRGFGDIVPRLLEEGADVNAQEEVYGSALQAASLQGHEQIVQ